MCLVGSRHVTYDVQIGTRLVSGDVIRLFGPCAKDGRSWSPLLSDESNPSPSSFPGTLKMFKLENRRDLRLILLFTLLLLLLLLLFGIGVLMMLLLYC